MPETTAEIIQTPQAMPSVIEETDRELIKKAGAIVSVQNHEEWRSAQSLRKEIKDRLKERRPSWDMICATWDTAHKKAVAMRNNLCGPFTAAVNHLSGPIQTFINEEERKELAEKRRLEAEAKKKADDEQLAMALEAEKEGNEEEAKAIMETPVEPMIPVVPKSTGGNKGYRSTWSAEVPEGVKLMELVKAVAGGRIPLDAIQPNMVYLNQKAVQFKTAWNWSGCKALEKRTPS